MRLLKKALVFALMAACICTCLPALQPKAQAAGTPQINLIPTTAVNPYVDCFLDAKTFSSGGPFTVSFEWKATNIKTNDAADPNAYHAFVGITGTIKGSSNSQASSGVPGIKDTTDWIKQSFQFQNVGTYTASGADYPGNFLRFGMWKAKGTLSIRNLTIKNTAGTIVYAMNSDDVIIDFCQSMDAAGITETSLANLGASNTNCKWTSGQFSTGKYTATFSVDISGGSSTIVTTNKPTTSSTTQKPTTIPTTRPTTAPTTSPTTAPTTRPTNPCYYGHTYRDGSCIFCGVSDPYYVPTAATTTKKPATSTSKKPVTTHPCVMGHSFVDGFCFYCGEPDPDYVYDPCRWGHDFANGICTVCGTMDPNYTPTTTHPTTPPAATQVQKPAYPGANSKPDMPNLDPGSEGGSGLEGGTGEGEASSRRRRGNGSDTPDLTIPIAVGGGVIALAVIFFLVLRKRK